MQFYNTVKEDFGYEPYLNITDSNARKAISRIRASAHDLKVETGRYLKKDKTPSITDKLCRFCCSDSEDTIAFEDLPFYDPIPEDEPHAMTVCPAYHHLRANLSDELKSLLLLHQFHVIMSHPTLGKELGLYLHRCYAVLNPKEGNTNKNVS